MIGFPTAKLNFGLHITGKRPDEYHNLQTIFYQFPLHDILEIVERIDVDPGTCTFQSTGLPIPDGENLCVKAYYLLASKFDLPGVSIHLHKIIPVGAGLGGGSSNAAYTLKILNNLFKLELSDLALRTYALELGSDCPLFIDSHAQYAEGRGELLSKINLDLSGYHLLIVNPRIHISTREAFSNINPTNKSSFKELMSNDVNEWSKFLFNDFEQTVFPLHPELKEIKQKMYEAGAAYASMSGSGSTIFALFNKEIPNMDWDSHYFVWKTYIL